VSVVGLDRFVCRRTFRSALS